MRYAHGIVPATLRWRLARARRPRRLETPRTAVISFQHCRLLERDHRTLFMMVLRLERMRDSVVPILGLRASAPTAVSATLAAPVLRGSPVSSLRLARTHSGIATARNLTQPPQTARSAPLPQQSTRIVFSATSRGAWAMTVPASPSMRRTSAPPLPWPATRIAGRTRTWALRAIAPAPQMADAAVAVLRRRHAPTNLTAANPNPAPAKLGRAQRWSEAPEIRLHHARAPLHAEREFCAAAEQREQQPAQSRQIELTGGQHRAVALEILSGSLMDRVADHVMRRIEKHTRIERERRGG
ncbi:hypothetical protein [Paraburkholderia sp. RAU2J]|uniref:hypothetical protein n=1 Tax=Paraburkholderia sp. RAU2J TaxID=1938810 RepID=UPI0011C3C2ED|nr:hypothetical protein [Paraburkholderia sp. RAU2J]